MSAATPLDHGSYTQRPVVAPESATIDLRNGEASLAFEPLDNQPEPTPALIATAEGATGSRAVGIIYAGAVSFIALILLAAVLALG